MAQGGTVGCEHLALGPSEITLGKGSSGEMLDCCHHEGVGPQILMVLILKEI